MHLISYMELVKPSCFGETTELTGGEHLVEARCRNDEVKKVP
jgi:(2R)-sulfolactate sulfo-lyase subunit beta